MPDLIRAPTASGWRTLRNPVDGRVKPGRDERRGHTS